MGAQVPAASRSIACATTFSPLVRRLGDIGATREMRNYTLELEEASTDRDAVYAVSENTDVAAALPPMRSAQAPLSRDR
jgi:hypothetical protein